MEYAQLNPAEYASIIRDSSNEGYVNSVIISRLPVFDAEDILFAFHQAADNLDKAAERPIDEPDVDYDEGGVEHDDDFESDVEDR